ncbi:hypothetical protein FRX31_031485, partial [Thalictrum thalictroides]
ICHSLIYLVIFIATRVAYFIVTWLWICPSKLGHRGQHFVESMAKLTGDKSNHENSKSVLNEDDMEKQNYEDFNLILGKDCVPYGD